MQLRPFRPNHLAGSIPLDRRCISINSTPLSTASRPPRGHFWGSRDENAHKGSIVDMNELWCTVSPSLASSVSQFHPPSSLWFFTSHSNISRTRGSLSNPNSASVRAMFPVTHGSQTKRHPRKSSSGYFGGGHERSCTSITRRKYSAPLLIEGFVRGTPNSANNMSAQTVAFHFGQYTSSPSPQCPAGCCSLKYSATGPQDSIPFRADTTSASLWDLSRISLRVQYRTPGFSFLRSQATA